MIKGLQQAVLSCGLLLLSFSLTHMTIADEAIVNTAKPYKPQRIASLSLCTDQLLLMLVEPDRIASVSFLAKDPVYSFEYQTAQSLRHHNGLAEEIVPLKPDLIIGSVYSSGNLNQMLDALGYSVNKFNSPTTLTEVEAFTRDLAKLVGETARGEIIIAAMHDEIKAAQDLIKHLPKRVAISYGPNGYTSGTHTLKHQVFELASYHNLASQLGIDYYGNLSVEQLIAAKPDVVIIDEAIPNQDSLAQNYINHPALKRLFQGKKMPSVSTKFWLCPGPSMSKAVMSLAQHRLKHNY